MYLALMCQNGREQKVIEAFTDQHGSDYQGRIKLHLFERTVRKIDTTGKSRTIKENIMPGYIVAEINENTDEAYYILKALKYVWQVLRPGEVTKDEYDRLVNLVSDSKVQIAEPDCFYENELIMVEKELKHTFKPEVKTQLLAQLNILREQKRRYLQYLRNLPQIIGFRIIKGKRAIYEFSLELLQVLEVRDNLNQHTGGRGDPIALAVRLAQASLTG